VVERERERGVERESVVKRNERRTEGGRERDVNGETRETTKLAAELNCSYWVPLFFSFFVKQNIFLMLNLSTK
jgi:hypothetical protein